MIGRKEEVSILGELFYGAKVRKEWDEDSGEEYIAIVDIIEALTDQKRWDAENYWRKLKNQMYQDGCEWVKRILSLPLYDSYQDEECLTEVATKAQIFRIIQSISSPEAETLKQWMSENAERRFDEIDDPGLIVFRSFLEWVDNLRANRFPEEFALEPLKKLGEALVELERMPNEEELYTLFRFLIHQSTLFDEPAEGSTLD